MGEKAAIKKVAKLHGRKGSHYKHYVKSSQVTWEKRQPLKELMILCTTQSSVGRVMPIAMATSCPQNHVALLISQSLERTCGCLM